MCCSGRALQPGRRRCPDKCIFFWQLEKSHRIYHSGFMVQSTEGTSPMMETVSICARGGGFLTAGLFHKYRAGQRATPAICTAAAVQFNLAMPPPTWQARRQGLLAGGVMQTRPWLPSTLGEALEAGAGQEHSGLYSCKSW